MRPAGQRSHYAIDANLIKTFGTMNYHWHHAARSKTPFGMPMLECSRGKDDDAAASMHCGFRFDINSIYQEMRLKIPVNSSCFMSHFLISQPCCVFPLTISPFLIRRDPSWSWWAHCHWDLSSRKRLQDQSLALRPLSASQVSLGFPPR